MPPLRVFILGTGRSGTMTCAALLSSLPGCRVVHQLAPTLLAEATDYVTGAMPHEHMVRLLRRTRGTAPEDAPVLTGESNQRLAFVLPALAEAFPDARYLWVVRDGRDAVASMHHRLWYHPREATLRHRELREWATNRIRGDHVGDMSPAQWNVLDPFGRCCWYWAYTNRTIGAVSARLGLRVRCVQLERLHETLDGVLEFLHVPSRAPTRIPTRNRTTAPSVAAWWNRPTPPARWSRAQRRVFLAQAGSIMDEHYAGWEASNGWARRATTTADALVHRSAKSACLAAAAWTRPVRTRLSSAIPNRAPGAAAAPTTTAPPTSAPPTSAPGAIR